MRASTPTAVPQHSRRLQQDLRVRVPAVAATVLGLMLAVVASPCNAEEPARATEAESAPAASETHGTPAPGATDSDEPSEEAETPQDGAASAPSPAPDQQVDSSSAVTEQAPVEVDIEAQPPPVRRREPHVKVLKRKVQQLLLLREMIPTAPFEVAGLKLYVDVQPVAEQNRPKTTSQLTVGVGPDRVVVFGAF